MSISPVKDISNVPEGPTSLQSARHPGQPHAGVAGHPIPPGSGNSPRPEIHVANDGSAALSRPEDEVQLQHDTELKNRLIVEYVDKSGKIVVQVPSEQMLRLERAIAEELQAAGTRPVPASSTTQRPEGESHGH